MLSPTPALRETRALRALSERTPARLKRQPKKPTPQFTATSRRTAFARDTRPALHDLLLPGPRRAQEGRGGAVAGVDTLRCLIRSPLIAVYAAAIPARTCGRPAAVPDHFWVFYLAATRHFSSSELLDQELRAHWDLVREEFWFEHSILLPNAKSNGDVPNGDDFRKWRTRNILPRTTKGRPVNQDRLEQLMGWLTNVSIPLALAVRRAEGGDGHRDLLTPAVWDCIAADGTVLDAPSDVRERIECDEDGAVLSRTIHGTRAKDPKNARVHHEVTSTGNKPHGAKKGLFNVAAVTKGLDTYTRVVVGLDIGHPGEGEVPIAMRVLHSFYARAGQTFPVLLYDGAIMPIHFQELMATHGVYCVNANYARPGAKHTPAVIAGPDGPQLPLGRGRRRYGVKAGQDKRTYTTPLESVNHEVDGYIHQHHLAADDGAVYETNRPALAGGTIHKVGLLVPTRLERLRDDIGEYFLRLTLSGDCAHGDRFHVSYELRKTRVNRDGNLPWTELVANIRVLPDALVEQFAEVAGRRNQVESFFSWLERCFYRKDRHASWGRDAQLFDLIGAALLHNTQAWAHLAYRHPAEAERLRRELATLAESMHDQNDNAA